MTAVGGVDVLAVLDAVANSIHSPEEGLVSLAHHELSEFLIARDLIAELIAADKEYDEARAAILGNTLPKQVTPLCARFREAKNRRASAIAALENQP